MIVSIIRNTMMFAVFILSMWMLYSGMMKLVPFPGMEESFMVWGYSKTAMQIIGVIEIILAIAVFAKPSRNIAFVVLILLMSGALYTHISHYEYEEIGPAAWIMVACITMLAYDLLGMEKILEEKLDR